MDKNSPEAKYLDIQDKVEYLDDKKDYQIIPYDEDSLLFAFKYSKVVLNQLEDVKVFPDFDIENSKLYKYFSNYFKYTCTIDKTVKYEAKTILIEKKFISESYLNDIKNFYADCFSDYNKFCTRIHLFDIPISASDFKLFIEKNEKKKEIKKSYLGHITIKPTGNSIIGPTFLKPYPIIEKRIRHYKSTVKAKFNIFGKRFRLRGLVFQEQDETIGLCATQAVWFTTHALAKIFRTKVLFPGEISIRADISEKAGRIFPNLGFTNLQIYKVYQSLGLSANANVAKYTVLFNNDLLKRTIYAYNRCGIPILLGYKRAEKEPIASKLNIEGIVVDKDDGAYKDNLERHIVSVIGYRINEKPQTLFASRLPSYSERIVRLYAHDDQWGPYAKIGFLDSFSSQIEVNYEGNNSTLRAEVVSVIIPLKNSIRIRLKQVEFSAMSFDMIHNNIMASQIPKYLEIYRNQEWEIYLDKGVDYKNEILGNLKGKDFPEDTLFKIAYTSFPEYIWIARLYCTDLDNNRLPLYDIIYDASESPSRNNFCIYKIFVLNEEYCSYKNKYVQTNKAGILAMAHLDPEMRFSEMHIKTINKMMA